MPLHRLFHMFSFFLIVVILAACAGKTPPTTAALPTRTASLTAAATSTLISSRTPEPSPTPEPHGLTICLGAEPYTLAIYGGSMYVQGLILSAIYDGPIDSRGYDFQPVILEKLPSLENGDAQIQPVTVAEGDRIVDTAGIARPLAEGVRLRPAGCRVASCELTYSGGAVEMDQLSADFTLREGLKWSDGTPLSAQDSVFSYGVARYANSDAGLVPQRSGTTMHTASYTPLDERTTRWVGLPGFLDPYYRTNFYHPLPRFQLNQYPAETLLAEDFELTNSRPLGWGPYRLSEWKFGKYIELERNPFYFRAAEGLPRFDRLTFRFIGDDESNYERLSSGECDVLDQEAAWAFSSDRLQRLLDLDAAGQLRAQVVPGTVWEHLDFGLQPLAYDDGYQPGTDRPDFFGDPRTRQGFALCLDRKRVVDEVLFGFSPIPDTYLPDNHPLYDADNPTYVFDPAAGAALLEAAGWLDPDGDPATPRIARGVTRVPDGTPFSVGYWTTNSEQRQQVSQILADSLTACGIQANVETFEASEFFGDAQLGDPGKVFGRDFDLAEFAWLSGYLPNCELFLTEQIPGPPEAQDINGSPRYPEGWGGFNAPGYSNPDFDAACRAARASLPGEAAFDEAHRQAQVLFAADLPMVPLFFRTKATASRADFCGLQPDPSEPNDFWNIEAFDFGEGCP